MSALLAHAKAAQILSDALFEEAERPGLATVERVIFEGMAKAHMVASNRMRAQIQAELEP